MYNVSSLVLFGYDFIVLDFTFVLFLIFSDTKFKVRTVIMTVLFSAIISLFSGRYDSAILPVLIIIITLINYKWPKIIGNKYLLIFIFSYIIQSLIGEFSVWFARIIINTLANNRSINIFVLISIVINSVLIIITIYFYKKNIFYITKLKLSILGNNKINIMTICFLVINIIVIFSVNIIFDMNHVSGILQGLVVFILFLVFFTNLYFFYLYITLVNEKNKLQIQKQKDEEFRKYMEVANQNYNSIKKFKHDYKNILIGFEIFVERSKDQDFKDYFKKVVGYSDKVLTFNQDVMGILNNIKSKPIKSILLTKINLAKSKGIEFHCEIDERINDTVVDEIDLSRILSILLDNAIESSMDQVKKIISFAIVKYTDGFDIVVENHIDEPEKLNVNYWFIKNYSTKGNNHGEGLKGVESFVSSNDKLSLNASIKNHTVQIVLIVGDNNA